MKIILKESKKQLKEDSKFAILQSKIKPKNMQELYKVFESELQAGKLSPISVAFLLHQNGFMPDEGNELVQGVHIVLGESVGNPSLERLNNDKTKDYGLWQINDRNIYGSIYHKKLVEKTQNKFDEAIKTYQNNARISPEEKKQKIETLQKRKKKAISEIDSGWGVPFVSVKEALDPFRATGYAKIKMERMKEKLGEDKKWFGWVDSISKLNTKYGADKGEIARKAVQEYLNLFNASR